MTVIDLIATSTAKAIARIGDLFTYDPITPELGANECPYLGHIPDSSPKMSSRKKAQLAGFGA